MHKIMDLTMVNTDPSKLEKETEKPSEVLMSNGIGLEAFHIPSAGIAPQAPVTKKHVMMSGPQQARFVLPITNNPPTRTTTIETYPQPRTS
jgi:hypothetical protein